MIYARRVYETSDPHLGDISDNDESMKTYENVYCRSKDMHKP